MQHANGASFPTNTFEDLCSGLIIKKIKMYSYHDRPWKNLEIWAPLKRQDNRWVQEQKTAPHPSG